MAADSWPGNTGYSGRRPGGGAGVGGADAGAAPGVPARVQRVRAAADAWAARALRPVRRRQRLSVQRTIAQLLADPATQLLGDHLPRVPYWSCRGCQRPWPCAPARVQLSTQVPRAVLPAFMTEWLAPAALTLPADRRAPGELYERFVAWTLHPPIDC